MQVMDETQLVELAQGGDTSSYEQLFDRYQTKIYNYVYSIAGSVEDAQDVTQEAFIKVLQALPKIDRELNFSAYLYRTAHNLAIDAVKARKRFASPEALDFELDSSLYADPERATLLKEQQTDVRKAAFELSDDHRAILTLREIEDLSYAEIGSVLDMPKNTVGVLLSRARLKFKGAFRMSAVDVDRLTQECKTMLPQLSAYIDDELTAEERERADAHLEDCPLCRLALEEMTEASKSYRALIPLIPAAAIRGNVMARVANLAPTPDGSVAEPTVQMDRVAADVAEPATGHSTAESAAKRSVRQAIRRILGQLTPVQKGLLGAMLVVLVGGSMLGAGLGLAAIGVLGRDNASSALQPLYQGLPQDALTVMPTIEETPTEQESASDEERVREESSGGSEERPATRPSTEPSQSTDVDGDDSQLGDQPGDVNDPDTPPQQGTPPQSTPPSYPDGVY